MAAVSISSGHLIYRLNPEPELLLLHYKAGHWDFPRGVVEPGEAVAAAALREIEEETGITAAALQLEPGFQHEYSYLAPYPEGFVKKHVILGLAFLREEVEVVLSHEHKAYFWAGPGSALRRLTHPDSREALNQARAFMSWK